VPLLRRFQARGCLPGICMSCLNHENEAITALSRPMAELNVPVGAAVFHVASFMLRFGFVDPASSYIVSCSHNAVVMSKDPVGAQFPLSHSLICQIVRNDRGKLLLSYGSLQTVPIVHALESLCHSTVSLKGETLFSMPSLRSLFSFFASRRLVDLRRLLLGLNFLGSLLRHLQSFTHCLLSLPHPSVLRARLYRLPVLSLAVLSRAVNQHAIIAMHSFASSSVRGTL